MPTLLQYFTVRSINDSLLKKLQAQAVQNAAARVTTETRKFDHIMTILRELN